MCIRDRFYGTDFNFLYSEEMQRAIAHNCLNANWNSLMNFGQHNAASIHEELGQFVNNNGMQLDLDAQMNEIMRESFKVTKKYIWKGVFSFLFYFSALYTLMDGVLPIMAQTFPGTETKLAPPANYEVQQPQRSPTDLIPAVKPDPSAPENSEDTTSNAEEAAAEEDVAGGANEEVKEST